MRTKINYQSINLSKREILFCYLTPLAILFFLFSISQLFADHRCPSGYYWNGKKCVRNDSIHKDYRRDCPNGYYWNGRDCVRNHYDKCPSGYYWNGTRCVKKDYHNHGYHIIDRVLDKIFSRCSSVDPVPTSPGHCYSWNGFRWYYDINKCRPEPACNPSGVPSVVSAALSISPIGNWVTLDRSAELDPNSPYNGYRDNVLNYDVNSGGIDGIEIIVLDEDIFIDSVYATYANGEPSQVSGINGFYPEGSVIKSYDIDDRSFLSSLTIVGYSADPAKDASLTIRVYSTY